MSYRLRFEFWLDMDNPEHERIADIIELLKNERQFASTIRDGLRLVYSLRHGDTDALLEMFPHIASHFQIEAITQYIDAAIAERKSAYAENLFTTPRPLPELPTITAPVFEDEDEIAISNDTSTESAMNFIESMMRLQGE